MRQTSVLVKYSLLLIALVILMMILLNTVGLDFTEKKLVESKTAELYTEANDIINKYLSEYYVSTWAQDEVVSTLNIAAEMTDTRILMLSKNGLVVADTTSNRKQNAIYVALGTSAPQLMADNTEKDFVVPKYIPDPMLCVSVPIMYNYTVSGYLCVMTTMSSIYAEGVYYSDFVNICYLIFIPFMIGAFALLYFYSVHPVTKLTGQTKEYMENNFRGEFKVSYPKELAELGGCIRYMGDKLNNSDEIQRKFLSNVSHDFRSPLTSIRGYLEAMKDGTIETADQGKYFDILLYETDRLTKLTSNLLQLNNIDDNGLMLSLSVFDINKMIRQIALTFEGTFIKKKLVLNLVFSQKETFVEADEGRIQQVIYNLLDNAVKFSNSDSSIKITTEEKGHKVYVTVKDYGVGIPKESINKVWERFYKSDASRGRDKKGSGLGLSIVKEIIKAHDQNISVVSTEGVGTEFIFTLKSAE
ncbi:MAG: HAMP domain-containing histidine kinase [Lachnospiraceae bacterium]|nr:HAMP domain-containing histidine kinase [Lachnospiraceae bacterium]